MNERNVATEPLRATWEPKVLTVSVIALTLIAALSPLVIGSVDVREMGSPMWMFAELKASFTLVMLVTGVIFTAVFTGIIAWEQVRLAVRASAPIVGVAIVWAGAIDGFYMMLGDNLIAPLPSDVAKANVLAFVWAVCRSGAGLILLAAVLLVVRRRGDVQKSDLKLVCIVAPVIFVVGYLVASRGGGSAFVQNAELSSGFIKRPWDLMPMLICLVGAIVIYPAFHRQVQTQFSLALWLSLVPEIAGHVHLALFSTAIFDSSFYIGNVLILIAYLTRLGGLLLDHSRSYVEIEHKNIRLQEEIEERQRAQEAEREQEHIYRQLVEALPIAVFRKNADGRFDFVNQKMCDLVQMSHDDMIGKTYADVYPEELATSYQQTDEQVMSTRETVEKTEPYRGVNKGEGWVHYIIMPVVNHKDEVVGVRGLLWDMTELFEAKEKLEQATEDLAASEAQRQMSADAIKDIGHLYQSLVDSLPISVFRKDEDGLFTYVNDRFCVTTGLAREDVLGRSDADLFPEDLAEKYKRDDDRVVSQGETLDLLEENIDSDGNLRRVRVFKSPVQGASGEIVGLHGVFWEADTRTQGEHPEPRPVGKRTDEPAADSGRPPTDEPGNAPENIIADKADEDTADKSDDAASAAAESAKDRPADIETAEAETADDGAEPDASQGSSEGDSAPDASPDEKP